METLKYLRATIIKVIPCKPSSGYSDFILQGVTESQADDITLYKANPKWWIKKTKNKPVIKTFTGIIPEYNRDPDMVYATEEEEAENVLLKYVEIFIDKYKYEWRASLCLDDKDGTIIQIIYKDRKVFGYMLDLRIVKEKNEYARFAFNMLVISEEVVEAMDILDEEEDFEFYRNMDYEAAEWKSYILKDKAKEKDKFSNYLLISLVRDYVERLSISTYGDRGSVRVVGFGPEPVKMRGSIVVDDYRRDDVVSEQEFIRHYNDEFRGKGICMSCGEELVNAVILNVVGIRKWKHGSIINIDMIEIT